MKMAPMERLALQASHLLKCIHAAVNGRRAQVGPFQAGSACANDAENSAAASPRIDLPPLDFVTGKPVPVAVAVPIAAREITRPRAQRVSVLDDPARQRVRDRYVAARFPGVARSSADLAKVKEVIKAANLYFEDGDVARSEELLDLAAALQPEPEGIWLARLELALLMLDSESYRVTALRFRTHHPASASWPEIVAVARTLCLTGEPFCNYDERGGLANYPTPLSPNWLRDSWELAPKFKPADLRASIMADEHSLYSPPAQKVAA